MLRIPVHVVYRPSFGLVSTVCQLAGRIGLVEQDTVARAFLDDVGTVYILRIRCRRFRGIPGRRHSPRATWHFIGAAVRTSIRLFYLLLSFEQAGTGWTSGTGRTNLAEQGIAARARSQLGLGQSG